MTTFTDKELIKEIKERIGSLDVRDNIERRAYEIALASLEVEPIGFRCRRNDNLGDWSYVYHREPDDFERKHLVIEGIYAAPPAQVVPEEKPMPNPLSMYAVDAVAAIAEVRGWNACRAAMLQSGNFRENKNSSTNNFREIAETSTNSPVIPDGLSTVCAEAYQVVGVMADALGVFGDAAVQKVLDNLSQQKLVHRDVLPFSLPVTPDGWISCSERMPNDKQYVWCWGKSYGWTECDTFEGYYDWSRNKWWAVTDDVEEPASKVTHWMPLPEPPQEVK
ncbi:DUF551 domain-containing protein [Escherichia coli]|nr:DUF551 domain-containing protein [Escherichia coli]ELY7792699.1 DUF551 domain-containing protein [Shigella sonnei]EHN4384680.1 DUF551 domain-containing protein [Escherichia coli]EHN4440661.1 DUF551 domain-containing protein [Escherichia coli]EHO1199747.1 DUF551 domain-containing protein [Escherichia coli]